MQRCWLSCFWSSASSLLPVNPYLSAAHHSYFEELGDAVTFTEAAGDAAGASVAAGDAAGEVAGTGVGVASGSVVCNTECEPVTPGSESISAISMKAAAAPIVIFERMLAVPRGPSRARYATRKQIARTRLAGLHKTTVTSTRHARINSPYKCNSAIKLPVNVNSKS